MIDCSSKMACRTPLPRSKYTPSLHSTLTLPTAHNYNSSSSATETISPDTHLSAPEAYILQTNNGIGPRRRSNISTRISFLPEDLASLTRTAPANIGHDEAVLDSIPSVSCPKAAKTGPVSTIRELPSAGSTPFSTRPASPVSGGGQAGLIENGQQSFYQEFAVVDDERGEEEFHYGSVGSWKGALILIVTCGSQFLDNVFMTSVNISLPAIQREWDVKAGDLQWLISAYTLTFGGFLLLAGVLSDRLVPLSLPLRCLYISLNSISRLQRRVRMNPKEVN